MADWSNVTNAQRQGYLMGRETGGNLSGLGQVISKVADRLRQQRETGEAMQQKRDLLGMEESSRMRLAEKEGEIKSKLQKEEAELKPKEDTIQPIVDKTGKIVGYRPKGAVFQPQSMGFWDEDNPGTSLPISPAIPNPLPAPTGRFNPLRVLPGYADYGENKKDAYNALRSRGISEKEAKKRLGL